MEFEEIYRAYLGDVYRYILALSRNKSVAEDITQEAFLSAIKNLPNYEGRGSLKSWLCQIAKNKYFDYLKKNGKIDFRQIEENETIDDNSIEIKLISTEEALNVHQILHRLEEPYREVFSLHLFAELSFRDIGTIFNKTENWARVTYYRAKLKIREAIK